MGFCVLQSSTQCVAKHCSCKTNTSCFKQF